MGKITLKFLVIIIGVYSNSLLSEPNDKSENATDNKYFKDALECQRNAQISHEIMIDVGQSKEEVKIPSGIDANVFSNCMKNFGYEIDIKEDKFLAAHQICQEKAKSNTILTKQNNKLIIEAPSTAWFQECYQSGGIVVEVID